MKHLKVNLIFNIVCLLLVKTIEGERILVVLSPPIDSHHNFFIPYLKELVKRGHDVAILTPLPQIFRHKLPNVTTIDVSKETGFNENDIVKVLSIWMTSDKVDKYKVSYECGLKVFKTQFEADSVKRFILENKKIDLIMTEEVGPSFVLGHIFDAPVLKISPIGFQYFTHYLGLSRHPIYYPDTMNVKSYDLTIMDKIRIVIEEIKLKILLQKNENYQEALILDMFGPNMPSLDELSEKVAMHLVSAHPVWDGNRPVSKEYVFIEGLKANDDATMLSDELRSYLNISTDGAVYVCFGTTTRRELLPEGKLELFLKVLAKLPYNFIWSWNTDQLPELPGNVRVFKWLPQAQLLKHPNIKLFFTHGGAHSTSEAIDAGVPVLIIPIFADQFLSAEKVVFNEIGLRLDWKTLDDNNLNEAIATVISDTRYRTNSQRLRSFMRDDPHTALERSVWYTEHLIRHKGFNHHRSPAKGVTWSEYLVLDLVFLLLGLGLVIVMSGYLSWKCVRQMFGKKLKLL